MDPQEIRDWVDFCEGRKTFDRDHFSTFFMELYLEPLTENDRNDLRTVFKYLPNSSRSLEKMMRMDDRAEDKTDEQIVDLVRRDLHEKRKLIDSEEVVNAIDTDAIAITLDEDRFDEVTDRVYAHRVVR